MKNLLLLTAVMFYTFNAISQDANKLENSVKMIDTETLHKIDFSEDNRKVLLDVRTIEEYKRGAIPGSVTMDVSDPERFKRQTAKLDKTNTYYIYCKSGNRSNKAAGLLLINGFDKIYSLEGGITEWRAKDLPIELN